MKRIDTDNINGRAEIMAREELLRTAKVGRANLATKFEDLLGDGSPADETADEMVRAIREWRDLPSRKECRST